MVKKNNNEDGVYTPSEEVQVETCSKEENGIYLLYSKKYKFNDLDVVLNRETLFEDGSLIFKEPRIYVPERQLKIARELKVFWCSDQNCKELDISYDKKDEELIVKVWFVVGGYHIIMIAQNGSFYFYPDTNITGVENGLSDTLEILRVLESEKQAQAEIEEKDLSFSFKVSQEFLKILKSDDQKGHEIRVDYYHDNENVLQVEDYVHCWAKTYVRVFDDYGVIDIRHDDYNKDDMVFFEEGITPEAAAVELWLAYIEEANKNNRRKYIMSLVYRDFLYDTIFHNENYLKEEYQENDYSYKVETLAGEKLELAFLKDCFIIYRNDGCDVLAKLDLPYQKEIYVDSEVEELAEKCIAFCKTFFENHQSNLDKLEEEKNRLFTS